MAVGTKKLYRWRHFRSRIDSVEGPDRLPTVSEDATDQNDHGQESEDALKHLGPGGLKLSGLLRKWMSGPQN